MPPDDAPDDGPPPDAAVSRSKVGRVIADRGLTGFGDRLERLWTGEDDERLSLRKLADRFNVRVLRAALDDAGAPTIEGEAEHLYELLTGSEASAGARIDAERRLEREGVDVERLRSEFVSHQAVHTYLRKVREVSGPPTDRDGSEEPDLGSIHRLRNRVSAVVETSVGSYRNADAVDIGDFDVFVDVRVVCNDCQSQYEVGELVERGSCECE